MFFQKQGRDHLTVEIPFARWYSAISHRRSRRHFDPKPLEASLLSLQDICAKFRPYPEAVGGSVTQSPDEVFKGAMGHMVRSKALRPLLRSLAGWILLMFKEVGYLGRNHSGIHCSEPVHLLGGRVIPAGGGRSVCWYK
jgi:hypothetical protein